MAGAPSCIPRSRPPAACSFRRTSCGRKGESPGVIPASLPAISGSGKPVSLTAADLKDLRASLKGKLILPQDAGYDAGTPILGFAFDRHPALIVLAADADDVVKAVQFARSHELLTAVGRRVTARWKRPRRAMAD